MPERTLYQRLQNYLMLKRGAELLRYWRAHGLFDVDTSWNIRERDYWLQVLDWKHERGQPCSGTHEIVETKTALVIRDEQAHMASFAEYNSTFGPPPKTRIYWAYTFILWINKKRRQLDMRKVRRDAREAAKAHNEGLRRVVAALQEKGYDVHFIGSEDEDKD